MQSNPASGTHRLADNIVSLYILQGLNYLVPLAVLPYLVRVLGMGGYGILAFAQSFAQYFTVLTDYGFNYSATRSIAKTRDDADLVSRHFCSVFVIKLLLMSVGLVCLLVIITVVPRFHHNASFFFVAYLAVIGNVLFPVWFYQGMEKMRYISAVIGSSKLLAAIALFIFVHQPQDTLLALLILSSGTFVGGLIGLVLAFRHFHLRIQLPSLIDLKDALSEGWHLFVSTAAVSMYTNTNVFLVGLLAGNVEAGYFSAADKLVRAMQGLIAPITQAVFPHVSSLAAESKQRALQFARKTFFWMGGLTLIPCLLLLALAPWVALVCFGHAGTPSVPIIRWIAFLPFIIAVSNVLGVQSMIPFGLDRQFSRILIAAGIFNVFLAWPLIVHFGAVGAGIAVLSTECLVTLTMLVVLERHDISIFSQHGISA